MTKIPKILARTFPGLGSLLSSDHGRVPSLFPAGLGSLILLSVLRVFEANQFQRKLKVPQREERDSRSHRILKDLLVPFAAAVQDHRCFSLPLQSTDGSVGNTIAFASQLHLLVNALDMSFEAQFMEDFVSVENSGSDNLKSSAVIPPPTVLDRVLKDLFHEVECSSLISLRVSIRILELLKAHHLTHFLRSFAYTHFGLATATYVRIFCGQSRETIIEAGQVNGDLSHTRMPSEDFVGKRDSGSMSDDSCHPETSVSRINSKAQDVMTSSDLRPSDCIRKGSAGVVGMMLLKSDQNLHVPFTQDAPLMTEDMHEERLNAVEALGSSFRETVLHYLETLRPHLLLEQMMVTKMGRLYLTMASTLKHLQANRLSVDSEITEDVKQLCVVFEHVEKLLTVAVSLHHEFLQAPRLLAVIFSDYYDFYLPTIGTGAVAGNRDMVKLKGDIDQGVEYYKKAMYYNWHYADAMYNLGVAYGEMLKFDMAIVFYELAFHFNPHCAEACNNLGVIYKNRDNLDKAVECYQLALSTGLLLLLPVCCCRILLGCCYYNVAVKRAATRCWSAANLDCC
ncbi:unnamed protein product [Camellia sinensis]